MTMGTEIKRIRLLRGLTQNALGVAIGFPNNQADVRIAQYEGNLRTPKAENLKKLATALNVSPCFLSRVNQNDSTNLFYFFIQCEDVWNMPMIELAEKYKLKLPMELEHHISEWNTVKMQLNVGKISQQEYDDWIMNWTPQID